MTIRPFVLIFLLSLIATNGSAAEIKLSSMVRAYIRNQEAEDERYDQMKLVE